MENKRVFKTLIKGSHKMFGGNTYVKGRINGFMVALCGYDDEHGYANDVNPNTGDCIMKVKTTPEEYEKFKKIVERKYPDLCEFDYNE